MKIAALVMGLSSLWKMTPRDSAAYLANLEASLDRLRENRVEIIWANIGHDGNRLSRCEKDGGLARVGEVIYRKPTQDTMLHPNDLRTFWCSYLLNVVAEAGPGAFRLFNDQTVAEYLAEHGFERLLVIGAVDDFCCTETAISGAIKGYDVTICTDLVLGWDPLITARAEIEGATLVWQGLDHAARIRRKIAAILADPIRYYSDQDRQRISGIRLQELDEALAGFELAPAATDRG